ncbi:hypothetical protein D3C75_1277960 [compost metagenome]
MKSEPAYRLRFRAVFLVTGDRMADIGHMHADLILASRLQMHLQQREMAVGLNELIMGHGMQTVTFMRAGIHFECRGFLQPGADRSFRLLDRTFH